MTPPVNEALPICVIVPAEVSNGLKAEINREGGISWCLSGQPDLL